MTKACSAWTPHDASMPDASASFDRLVRSRRSTRAFCDTPVPAADVRQLLEIASAAPSTFNTQPWNVHVLTGGAKQALSEAILAVHENGQPPTFSPFPVP